MTLTLLPPPPEPLDGQDDTGRPGLLGLLPVILRSTPQVMEWIGLHRSWPVGYCLKYVRSAHGVPAVYSSAIVAWANADLKHRGDRTPPKGVPCFYEGGRFGHVVESAGDGMVWSTDVLTRGRVDLVPLAAIEAEWHYTYLGWAADLNRHRVWKRPNGVSLKAVAEAARKDPSRPVGVHPRYVNRVRKALGMRLLTGRWSRAVSRRWRNRYGVDHPTAETLRKFCAAHNLTYKP